MSIKPLTKETIKLINSTQVISSIYSAVKELVENSLDAQATNIEVNLVDNGLSLIEVKDNGVGINQENAPYMALAACTSKISDFNDLDLLSTYGFRGEGLTAVCQVSNVTVCTKTASDEVVTCYTLDNEGNVVSSDITHGLTGTTVQMKDLFKNMPVRRNILNNKKRINQEIKAVEILLKTYAICKTGVRFLYRVNRCTIFSKPVCKNVSESVKSVLGVQIYSKLYCINNNSPEFQMQMFIPKKEIKDGSEVSQANYQFLCVNDRPIKSKEIEKKINKRISEFLGETESNRKYIFCLMLTVDPSVLDVNLEPNKDKVFLQNEAVVIDEIDKCLLSFYELTSSQISTQSDIENINCNENVPVREKEFPACKKRRISSQNENIYDVNVLKDSTKESDKNKRKSDNEFLKNINGPVLSDSDSNDADEFAKRKHILKNNAAEPMDTVQEDAISVTFDYGQQNRKKHEIIEETLSQLPEVDLGPDFDWEEVMNKTKEKPVFYAPKNNEAPNKPETPEMIWSKGQVLGLQGGVGIDGLQNNANANQEDSDPFDFHSVPNKIDDSQDLVSNDNVPIVEVNEFDWEVNMKNTRRKTPTKRSSDRPSAAGVSKQRRKSTDVDPTQTKIPFAGDNACLSTSTTGPSAFAMFCAETRKDILKKYPEATPPEVAGLLNNEWKKISDEERDFYRDLANQHHNKSTLSQAAKKPKSQPTEVEKEKNRKQLVNMLENMKMSKSQTKKESMIMRSFKVWDTSLPLLAEKFRSSTKKSETIIGSLNQLLWVVNLNSHLFVFDINELHNQLSIECDINKISNEYVQDVLDKWFTKNDDMSLFYPL